MDEIMKSIKATLYDRVVSPLSGTLIASWIAWNWRIFYVTFFIDQENLVNYQNKLDFINQYLGNPDHCFDLTLWPLLTAIFFLAVFPFISRWAYKLHLWFQENKVKDKIESENKIPLTLEESIKLRSDIRNFEKKIKEMNSENDSLISDYQLKNEELTKTNAEYSNTINSLNIQLEREKKELDFSTIWKGEWVYETYNFKGDKNIDRQLFEVEGGNRVFFRNDKSEFRLKLFERNRHDNYNIFLTRHKNGYRYYKLIFLEREQLNTYKGEAFEVEYDKEAEPSFKYRRLNIYKADELESIPIVDELEDIEPLKND